MRWTLDQSVAAPSLGLAEVCGIAGTYGFGDRDILRTMIRLLAHRGPDGEYLYDDPRGGVFLANRRLAIQDPAGGAQPAMNEDESVVVVFNGEIYNYPDLRKELSGKGHALHTGCDTEILPHLYEEHGIDLVHRLNGIYAFALWDGTSRTLYLARDPMGVKPLLYAHDGLRIAFGSEAKAVVASGLIQTRLDEASLHLTMNVRYIPGERTLFRGIRRLPPGHVLKVSEAGVHLRQLVEVDWTPDHGPSEYDWIEGIRFHLEAAVSRQLLSDVGVGVTLSGGVDSTAIVAMVRRRHAGSLDTFTLGFGEPTDEIDDARMVANHFGTRHREIVLSEPALHHLRDAIYFTEEPKVNCLQLYLLHRFVGRDVKVVLSGLGGDELFGGYDFYRYLMRLATLRDLIPRGLARGFLEPSADALARAGSALGAPSLDLSVRGIEWLGSLHHRARHYLLLRNAWDFNSTLLDRVYTADFRDRLTTECSEEFEEYFPGDRRIESEALRAEISTKLVNDLLHNEDSMSMAHSVESRVPLLDLEFVRFVARIPDDLRFGRGLKGLFKEALRDVVPGATLAKKKWGFTVDPVEQYAKDLEPMARRWLSPARLRESGIFRPEFVRQVLDARPSQKLRWHYFMLWQMIGIEMWRDLFLDGPVNSMERPTSTAGRVSGAL